MCGGFEKYPYLPENSHVFFCLLLFLRTKETLIAYDESSIPYISWIPNSITIFFHSIFVNLITRLKLVLVSIPIAISSLNIEIT